MLPIVDSDVRRKLAVISICEKQRCSGEAIKPVIYFNINDLADTSDKFSLSRIDLPEN